MNNKKDMDFTLCAGAVIGLIIGVCVANFGWIIESALVRGGDSVVGVIVFTVIIVVCLVLLIWGYNDPIK